MSRLVKGSRKVFLGVAFVGVMSVTGGMLGALAGVMMTLLSQVVLGMSAGLAELMPASVAFGTMIAMTFGLVLAARRSAALT